MESAVQKTASGKRIYENTFTQKGGSVRGFDEAGRDAYKQISPKISEALKAEIAK
ncbi:MAG: hypothetical protein II970_03535 [Paludibacteraceae bacterium]|nr:hypothetical protein [Paludibacteraceae bacterium]